MKSQDYDYYIYLILFDDEIKNIIQDFKINDGSTYTDASSLTEGMMD